MLKKGGARAQTAMEFLILFGFITLMLVPLIYIFFIQSGDTQDTVAINTLRNIGIKIIDKAESVYYMGAPSQSKIKVFFPDRINNIIIQNRELVFNYTSAENTHHEIVNIALINLTGSLNASSGVHYILIKAEGDSVSITEAS